MLLTTAFAAGGDAAAEPQNTSGTTLTFAVTLPDQMDTDQMEDSMVTQVHTVLQGRLEQLALSDAQITFPDDRKTVIVTLPDGTDTAPADVAAFLSQTNALSITDANGTVSLTRADVLSAEVGQSAEADGAPVYIQLTLTNDAQQALATLPEGDTLSVTLDGEAVGETVSYDADNAMLNITGGFDLNAAKLYVARIMAGTLPVTLTLTGETQPEEPEQQDSGYEEG